MEAETILAIVGGCLTVAGAIVTAVWKAASWHAQSIASMEGIRHDIGGLKDAMHVQADSIEANRKAITRVHARVDTLVDRAVTPSPHRVT